MTDPALELARMINSQPDFQRRLNDYTKAASGAEASIAQAKAAKEEAEATYRELDHKMAEQRQALAAAQADHDKVAKESAARIALLTEVEARNRKYEQELSAKEEDLKQREAAVETLKVQLTAALKTVSGL